MQQVTRATIQPGRGTNCAFLGLGTDWYGCCRTLRQRAKGPWQSHHHADLFLHFFDLPGTTRVVPTGTRV